MKICKKCHIEKNIDNFYKSKSTKDGFRGTCIDCHNLYYTDNRDKIINRVKKHKSENSEHYKEYLKEYYSNNKELIKENRNIYIENNKDKISESQKAWRTENKDLISEYRKRNIEKRRKNRREYEKKKKSEDPLYRITCSIRTLISMSIRKNGFSKKSKTSNILGCSFIEFKIHIESQFDENMNWDNYGIYWQIDHIYPISKYKDESHLIELNHYTNLRPLESSENNKKKNSIL